MSDVVSLEESRAKIDEIDRELVRLYTERMETAAAVAAYKKEKGLPVLDAGRERKLLARVQDMAGEEFSESVTALYSTILSLSRAYQSQLLSGKGDVASSIERALSETKPLFPERATIACQGVEGAYSQIATEKLFHHPEIMYFHNFEGVFSAIEAGLCRYGVLPIENSTAGSVLKVYDLMSRHRFHIVRSVRVKVDHCLLMKNGVKLSEVKEIFSHEQAIRQCAGFLETMKGVKVTPCENTAVAARMVAESERSDVAALSSRDCAELYRLHIERESVQDQDNNYTRFICISKELEIYPGADRTSIMMTVPHKPGSLYHLLSRFYALQVNLTKLESRPIPDRDFEFRFYFDLETSVYSPRLSRLITELESESSDFRYLGTYSETV